MDAEYQQVKLVQESQHSKSEIITFIDKKLAYVSNKVEFVGYNKHLYPGIWIIEEIYSVFTAEDILNLRNVRSVFSNSI